MSTAIVLAGPERKRILRELLSLPEPWLVAHRELYRRLVGLEWQATLESAGDDAVSEDVEKRVFGELIFKGIKESEARQAATAQAEETLRHLHLPRLGQQERERRRTFREAVTAGDGALAVTTGLVDTCIVCGGPFPPNCRSDAAYCSNACRTAAYRKRRLAPRKPISAAEKAALTAERQMMAKAARDAGLSQQGIRECIRVANLSEAELEELLGYHPRHPTTTALRAMHAAKRRQAGEEAPRSN